jgi:hypothetical protein
MDHCPRCGRPGTHDDCLAALAYEAPRFCERCGRKLRVQVYPDGFIAVCRDHGPAPGSLPQR